jgi:hypothetical protein
VIFAETQDAYGIEWTDDEGDHAMVIPKEDVAREADRRWPKK